MLKKKIYIYNKKIKFLSILNKNNNIHSYNKSYCHNYIEKNLLLAPLLIKSLKIFKIKF